MATVRLRQELLSVDNVIKEFTSVNQGSEAKVPSRRYPELEASKVSIKDCLENAANITPDFLRELLCDRLLYLLQCLLRFVSDGEAVQVPLSLGSVCRKVAKSLQDSTAESRRRLNEQASSIKALTDQNQLLNKELQDAIPTVTFVKRSNVSPVIARRNVDKGIQTTETCLSFCANCTETRDVLVRASGITSKAVAACVSHDPGGGDCDDQSIGSWLSGFEKNMTSVVTVHKEIVTRCTRFAEQVRESREEIKRKDGVIINLQEELTVLKDKLIENENVSEEKIANLLSKHDAEMKRLTKEKNFHLEEMEQLKRRVLDVDRKMTEQQVLFLEKEDKMADLKSVLTRSQGHLQQCQNLLSVKEDAIKELKSLQGEQEVLLHEQQSQLVNQEGQIKTLKERINVLQQKHITIIQQIEEMESERESLKGQLRMCEREKISLQAKINQSAEEAHKLKEDIKEKLDSLDKLQCCLDVSTRELQEMKREKSKVELRLVDLQHSLQESDSKCRLLVDYPSLPYGSDISDLPAEVVQKHTSSNLVRILLLEEQNRDLHGRAAPPSDQLGDRPTDTPVKLWQPNLFKMATYEKRNYTRSNLRSSSQPSMTTKTDLQPSGGQKYKGHMGHLAEALRSASQLSQDHSESGLANHSARS